MGVSIVGSGGSGGGGTSAPTATATVLGLVKPDGTTIANTAGAISVAYGTSANTAAQGNDSRITGAAQKASNLSDLANSTSARTNLGLGGAATLNVGTAAGTVAAGDDNRITGSAQKASNLSDLANTTTARTNLGLGGLATKAVPAAGVVVSDGTNLTPATIGTGLTFSSGTLSANASGAQAPNTQTASYTLVLADANGVVEANVAAANNVTVPPNSSVAFPVGTSIKICQYGAGTTTIVAGAGVTVRSSASLALRTQYAECVIRKRATDEWVASGDFT